MRGDNIAERIFREIVFKISQIYENHYMWKSQKKSKQDELRDPHQDIA